MKLKNTDMWHDYHFYKKAVNSCLTFVYSAVANKLLAKEEQTFHPFPIIFRSKKQMEFMIPPL